MLSNKPQRRKAQSARKRIVPIALPMRSSVGTSGGFGLLITSLCSKTSTPGMSLLLAKKIKMKRGGSRRTLRNCRSLLPQGLMEKVSLA
jgi:hypothetical protein